MSEATLPLARARERTANPIFLLAGLAILEMLIFVFGVALGATGWDTVVLGLALVAMFLGLLPVIFEQSRPVSQRHILITIIALAYTVFLVTPVFTQYFLQKGEFMPGMFRLTNAGAEAIIQAQLLSLLGFLCLLVGFYLPVAPMICSAAPKARYEWQPAAALAVALFMLPLGWMIFLAGQFSIIPRQLGSGALGVLSVAHFFAISLVTLVWLRTRTPAALLLLLIAVPITMGFNFFTGSKRLFLTPLFMVALAYIVFERRIRRSWALGGLVLLIVLYPVAQFYRDVVQDKYTIRSVEVLKDPIGTFGQISGFLGGVDFGEYLRAGLTQTGTRLDGMGILTTIVDNTPDRVPYQRGWTIAYIFLSYVPRVLWPGKPSMTIGEWVSQNYGSPQDLHTDVGPTWIGEFYLNFGPLGVVAGMLILGVFFRTLQELLFGWRATLPALLGATVVLYAAAWQVQGGLVGPINGTLYNMPVIVATHFLLRMFGATYLPAAEASASPARPAAAAS